MAKIRYKKIKCSCVVIQKHVRGFLKYQKYQRLYKATVIIQSYFRGWTARRNFEILRQQGGVRPYSSQSCMSMNSLGYSSLTTSVSSYSFHPSLLDVSPSEIRFGHLGAMSLSVDILNSYVSPQHQQRLLETEESGIETDTESINGDSGERSRPRKRRRRAHLQNLMQARARVHHMASDESVVDSRDKAPTSSGADSDHLKRHGDSVKVCQTLNTGTSKRHCTDDVTRKGKPLPSDAQQKMRVATLKSIQEITGVLKTCTPSEDLQIVLLKQSLSLFFKSGVLSYRRMPVVSRISFEE